MLANPYQAYQRTRAETARPADLVAMLYEGAISAIGRACTHMERRELDRAHTELLRAQDIVWELHESLDLRAGRLARELQALYAYMIERLRSANLAKQPEPAREVAVLLRELLPAWQEAARTHAADPQPERGRPARPDAGRMPALPGEVQASIHAAV